MPNFSENDFWEAFYGAKLGKETLYYEWMQPFDVLKEYLVPGLTKDSQVVDIGCGLSAVGDRIYDSGVKKVHCVDLSYQCIQKLKRRNSIEREVKETVKEQKRRERREQTYRKRTGKEPPPREKKMEIVPRRKINYATMDVTDLSYFTEGTIDLVFDKGTLDSLLCSRDDFKLERASAMVEEVYRILKPGSRYVCVSSGHRDIRWSVLESSAEKRSAGPATKDKAKSWKWDTMDVKKIPKQGVGALLYSPGSDNSNFHYIYTMTKPKEED